jgi:hypothetical protein
MSENAMAAALDRARAASSAALTALSGHARVVLAAIGAAWFGILLLSAFATPFPIVFGDEAAYLLPTLLGSGSDNYRLWETLTLFPSYLYHAIYGALSFGDPQKAAKVLNAAFIVAASLPAYATARHFVSERLSFAFALLVILAPVSSYVRYVMPEALYLFGFWICIWAFVETSPRSQTLCAVVLAVCVAAMSMIKPHALALAVGLMAFFVLRQRFAWRGFALAFAHGALFFTLRLAFGRLLTGEWITSLSGPDYANAIMRWPDLAAGSQTLSGHLCAIAVLIAVPLALTLAEVIRQWWRPRSSQAADPLFDLGLLACCLLGAMLAMTVYFAQSVYQQAPLTERATRLHGRYYLFVLPLFPLYAVSARLNGRLQAGAERLAAWSLIAMPLAAAVVVLLYEPNPVDFADIALLASRPPFSLAIAIPLVAALPWLIYRRTGLSPIKIAVAWWAMFSLATSLALIVAFPLFARPKPVDQAMMHDVAGLRRMATESRGVIFNSPAHASETYRLMFYLRSTSAARFVAPGTAIDDSMIPPEFRWAVLMFDVRYAGTGRVIRMEPLTIVTRQ